MTGLTLVIMICGASVSAAIASAKQRNVVGWMIAGALLPLITVIAIAFQPSLAPQPGYHDLE